MTRQQDIWADEYQDTGAKGNYVRVRAGRPEAWKEEEQKVIDELIQRAGLNDVEEYEQG